MPLLVVKAASLRDLQFYMDVAVCAKMQLRRDLQWNYLPWVESLSFVNGQSSSLGGV